MGGMEDRCIVLTSWTLSSSIPLKSIFRSFDEGDSSAADLGEEEVEGGTEAEARFLFGRSPSGGRVSRRSTSRMAAQKP